MQQGVLAAAAAYLIWGLFPIYWRWLEAVPAEQILSHRIVWCALFVCGWLFATQGLAWLRTLNRRVLLLLSGSTVFISINWWLYIWANNHGHIVEVSLGYFINPLINVVMGVLILKERLTLPQKVAVGIAAIGVLWLAVQAGHPPWIALVLAFSFGTYGLIRKLTPIPSVQGLAVESSLVFLPALGWLIYAQSRGTGSFGHESPGLDALLVLGGLVTAIPLVLFSYGARRVPLTVIGMLQYLAPTIQLLLAVFWFGEPFTRVQAIGFACIWAALLIYAADSVYRATRPTSVAI